MAFWKKLGVDAVTEDPGQQEKGAVSVLAEAENFNAQGAGNTADDLISDRFGKIRSALGPGTVIQGKLSFDTPVRIDGKLSGEVFSSRALIVGQTGRIDAQVQAASLIVMGSVNGSVKATERIEIWRGGQISGEISTPVLVVQEGSCFSVSCSMPSALKKTSA